MADEMSFNQKVEAVGRTYRTASRVITNFIAEIVGGPRESAEGYAEILLLRLANSHPPLLIGTPDEFKD